MLGPKTRICAYQVHETPDEQAGSDGKHQGQRDLRDNKATQQP
jgi:hypothetical protein